VRGYKEEGTTTTPFDMVVSNDLDRFHLVQDVIDRVPKLGSRCAHVRQEMADKLVDQVTIAVFGPDLPGRLLAHDVRLVVCPDRPLVVLC